MPTCSIEQAEAVRRYYAAFPALKKGRESPLQYYLPPPAWCRKTAPHNEVKMQSELLMSKDWSIKNKKLTTGKERRNSYHGQRKNNKKRCNSYSRSFESKENLPEWVTHEGVWDMETQDPVKEFIRAIALDEGYGTCENTVTDELKEINQLKIAVNDNVVPDWDDSLDFETEWVITEDLNPRIRTPMEDELYAKFEAKFDRSIEALWSKDQNTPDDEYQDLPIDFHDLLSSPSDQLFENLSSNKRDTILGDHVALPLGRVDSPTRIAEALHDRFRPLNLADTPAPIELDSFALYDDEDIYDTLAAVASTMRSFTAINHSRDRSGFAEVPPRRTRPRPPSPRTLSPRPAAAPSPLPDREDLLTSARTHFRPIRRETDAEAARYADGDTFDIRGDLDPVEVRRSESGGIYVGAALERYLEYRGPRTIDYGRLNLTAAQRCPDMEEPGLRLRFPLRQHDAAVQTERLPADAWTACEECGRAAKKMRAGIASIWSADPECAVCAPQHTVAPPAPAPAPRPDELSREWEELLSDISAAHAQYAGAEGPGMVPVEETDEPALRSDRKRRHSAALRCAAAAACTHPHARFLPCCALALDRPLTR